MISDKVGEIALMLIDSTKNGKIWTKKDVDPQFNCERILYTKSDDELSEFEVPVKYNLSGDKWVLESHFGMWIRNKSLPGGRLYASSYGNQPMMDLRDLLIRKFCSDQNPSTKMIEDKLTEICGTISVATRRDNILTRIFGG
jgi:hypothetical protein